MIFKYLTGVTTLEYNKEKCSGCGRCIEVCPHRIFRLEDRKAIMLDKDLCMECGACRRNCSTGAINVKAGVGCASAIINSFTAGKNKKAAQCC